MILDTLLNPILSNHFGFDVEVRSYFILGVALMFTASSLLL